MQQFDRIGVLLQALGLREFLHAMSQASLSQQQVTRSTGGLNAHMRASTFYTQQVGAGFITLRGAAGALALGVTTLVEQFSDLVKSGRDFEAQMAQIRQVSGLTVTEMEGVSDEVRRLSTVLPFTTAEISKLVTESARAGVEGRRNLSAFTQEMLHFATISGIAPEQAALDFAHLALAFEVPTDKANTLTSAVAALDRELPTNSREIVNFGLRIAAAGRVTGFTSGQVFGIAAAMTSLGIRAEAGGTAVQRVMFAIAGAVSEGGETLENFALVAGMTAEQFAARWRSDAAGAFTAFTEGLGRAGDKAQAVLKGLELGDVRLIRAFATTAGAGDLLRRSIELGNTAMGNTALAAERAAIVYATTESQVRILENRFADQARTIGIALLPAYRDLLSALTTYVLPEFTKFADLLSTDVIPSLTATWRGLRAELSPALAELGVDLSGTIPLAEMAAQGIKDIGIGAMRAAIVIANAALYIRESWEVLADVMVRPFHALRRDIFLLEAQLANFLSFLIRVASLAGPAGLLEGQLADLPELAAHSAWAMENAGKATEEYRKRTDNLRESLRFLGTDIHTATIPAFERLAEAQRKEVDAAKASLEVRNQARTFADLDLAGTRARIGVITAAIADYQSQLVMLREEEAGMGLALPGTVNALTREIEKQQGVLTRLREQEQALAKTAAGRPGGGLSPDFDFDTEKSKTGLQKLGVTADQARKFLESLGLATVSSDAALRFLGASANEMGESIEGFGISTAQATALMKAAGFSAEQIAASLARIRADQLAKEIEEAGKKSAAALKAITDRIEELTGGILDELVPAMELAASLVGEDFTGAMRGAAVATTAALTDALIQQAALVGGPYAGALIAVAGVLAEAARSTSDWKDTTEDLSLSAEAAVDALTHQAEAALELAKVNGDTEIAVSGMAAAVGQLRILFQRLPEDQRKVALRLLDGVDALITHAKAAGEDEAALGILLQGLEALTGGLGDYVDAVDKAIEADRKRAEEARTAEEELALARGKEERSTAALVTANERLLKARQALATARGGGDTDAIRAAGLEVSLARDAVSRAKDRAREARGGRGEAEIAVAEAVAPTAAEGVIAGEIIAESVAEAEARVKRERVRSRIAAIGTPEFIEGTVPLSVGSLPGADQVPLRSGASPTPPAPSSRNVTVNATYVTQPEVTVRHDLEALSMVGLV